MHAEIILASQSPRRQQLLQQLGINFRVCAANIDETPPHDLPLDQVAEHLAIKKAKHIFFQQEQSLVIAADTIVLLHNELLGKPKDAADAQRLLRALSGQKHEVITGVCIYRKDKWYSFSVATEVFFNSLTDLQIMHYITHHAPYDKAGGYAIQEYIGMVGIKEIRGDYYNVMGLPLSRLVATLAKFDVII